MRINVDCMNNIYMPGSRNRKGLCINNHGILNAAFARGIVTQQHRVCGETLDI